MKSILFLIFALVLVAASLLGCDSEQFPHKRWPLPPIEKHDLGHPTPASGTGLFFFEPGSWRTMGGDV